MKFLAFSLAFLLAPLIAQAADITPPLALVYDGPGSCSLAEGDCTGAAEQAAEYAGYRVARVGPSALTPASTEADYQKIFSTASVWVQPGGHSQLFLTTASPPLKTAIRRFVQEGKGYVGFCAGAFSATAKDADLDIDGLGIFPGKTVAYPNDTIDSFFDDIVSNFNPDALYNQILSVNWSGKLRYVYFEEGASLDLSGVPANQVEVMATFKSGLVAAARTAFGKGRVYITGTHPEAPMSWRSNPDLPDADGVDYDLVKEMLDWTSFRGQK